MIKSVLTGRHTAHKTPGHSGRMDNRQEQMKVEELTRTSEILLSHRDLAVGEIKNTFKRNATVKILITSNM